MTTTPPQEQRESARETILSAVGAALAELPTEESPDTPVERHYRRDRSVADPVGLLAARLQKDSVEVATCGPSEVAATVAHLLAGVGPGAVVCPPGLPQDWRPADLNLHEDDGGDAQALSRYAAGLTGCAVAIAETGTLVLDGGAVSGRRLLSLVPDLHVCVVRTSDVHVDVPQALAAVQPTAPLTFITGPSATVDIELVRTVGVHGPRRLHVVLVDESGRDRPRGD